MKDKELLTQFSEIIDYLTAVRALNNADLEILRTVWERCVELIANESDRFD